MSRKLLALRMGPMCIRCSAEGDNVDDAVLGTCDGKIYEREDGWIYEQEDGNIPKAKTAADATAGSRRAECTRCWCCSG
jgi:hypothetical protein